MQKDLVIRSTLLSKSTTPNTPVGRVAKKHMQDMARDAALAKEAIANHSDVVRDAQIKGMMAIRDAELLRVLAPDVGFSPEVQFAHQRLTTGFLYDLGRIVQTHSDHLLTQLSHAASSNEPDGFVDWLCGWARKAIR